MKNFQMRALLIVASLFAVFFTGCGEDEDSLLEPTFQFQSKDGAITRSGDTLFISQQNPSVAFSIEVLVAKGVDGEVLDRLEVTKRRGGNNIPINLSQVGFERKDTILTAISVESLLQGRTDVIDFGRGVFPRRPTSFRIRINETIGETGTYEYVFTATPKGGNNVASASITVIVAQQGTGPIEPTPTAAKSATGLAFANTEPFLATSGSTIAMRTQAQADANPGLIDLRYFYSTASSTHSFISPHILNTPSYSSIAWTAAGRNTTVLRVAASTADFNAARADQSLIAGIYNAASLATFTGNDAGVRAGGPDFVNNAIFAFRTQAGKHGLIRITNVAATGASGDVIVEN